MPHRSTNQRCSSPQYYACSLCGARFPSLQALGGHKSVHSSKRKYGAHSGQQQTKRQKMQPQEPPANTGVLFPSDWQELFAPILLRPAPSPTNLGNNFANASSICQQTPALRTALFPASVHHSPAEDLGRILEMRLTEATAPAHLLQDKDTVIRGTVRFFSGLESFPMTSSVPLSPQSQESSTPSVLLPSTAFNANEGVKARCTRKSTVEVSDNAEFLSHGDGNIHSPIMESLDAAPSELSLSVPFLLGAGRGNECFEAMGTKVLLSGVGFARERMRVSQLDALGHERTSQYHESPAADLDLTLRLGL